MLLKIKELKGNELSIQIESSDTVLTLKSKIEAASGVPIAEIKLLLSGKVLQDEKTLEEYKISESSKIMLTRTKVDLKNLIQKALGKFYDAEKGEKNFIEKLDLLGIFECEVEFFTKATKRIFIETAK